MTRMRFSINLNKLRSKSFILGFDIELPVGSRVVSWDEVEKFIGRSMVEGFDTLVIMDQPSCGLCDQNVLVEGTKHVLFRDPSYKSRKVFVPCTATARSKS